jgi:hypothetical protein
MRKFLASAAIAGLALIVTATPALAHECYNASRSAKGNEQIAAHSNAFVPFDAVAFGFFVDPGGLGLCAPGAVYLLEQIEASDFDTSIVVSIKALQSGGVGNSPSDRAAANLSNGKGIDHLEFNEELGALIGANIDAAFAICGP